IVISNGPMSLGGGHSAEGSNAGGIFVQFNQDCTSLVAGSSSGYHLFALTPDDGIEEIYASRSGQDTCLVDRLFSSSLVAIVTVAAPRLGFGDTVRPHGAVACSWSRVAVRGAGGGARHS
ncbi:jg24063, partial [Pararge aegeria aegeria]